MCCSSCLRLVNEAPLNDCPCEIGKPHLDLIEPGRTCGREMKFHIGMCLEPFLVLLVGVEVVENDVKLAVRKCCGHAIHKVEKLDPATSFRMRRKDLPGGDFQRGKQRGRAVPLVVVALPGQGSCPRWWCSSVEQSRPHARSHIAP